MSTMWKSLGVIPTRKRKIIIFKQREKEKDRNRETGRDSKKERDSSINSET